jgi:sigma-54 dependent transcriptional regulator, acetoin dehydrogenase operon transcriptional activator AcoR
MNTVITPTERLQQIRQARERVFTSDVQSDFQVASFSSERAWLEQSWRRCIAYGHSPEDVVAFDSVPREAIKRTEEANHDLLQAARPTMQKLGVAISSTRYFAVLTNAMGVVIDTDGVIDRSDPRAQVITRVGVDLSERSIGTSAISTALQEQMPVWLHRGEHFFNATSVYSCAGAPLFSPNGVCIGMLDLTGVDEQERPELAHIVAQSARRIENAMIHNLAYSLIIRLNWSGMQLGEVSDGLLAVDHEGCILGFNQAAMQMLSPHKKSNINDVFALSVASFFDAAKLGKPCLNVPLWSGLRVDAEPLLPNQHIQRYQPSRLPLKEVTSNLIKQTMQEAKGNVAEAAQKLGISRATLYRKLAPSSQQKNYHDPR